MKKGVYTILTLTLAQKLHSSFLNVLGAIYTLCIFALFTGISVRTVVSMRSGSMFSAPCLSEQVSTKMDDVGSGPPEEQIETLDARADERVRVDGPHGGQKV